MKQLKTIIESAFNFVREPREVSGITVLDLSGVANENFLKLSTEEVEDLERRRLEVREQNKKAGIHNRKLSGQYREVIEEFCNLIGLPTWKKSSGGKVIGEYKEFKTLLKRCPFKTYNPYPEDNPHTVKVVGNTYGPYYNISLVNLHAKVTAEVQRQFEKVEQQSKLMVESIRYLIEKGQSVKGLTTSEICSLAQTIASQEYLEKEYPEGTELETAYGTWVVGEKRSIEGARVELIVEGNLVTGFTAWPECY